MIYKTFKLNKEQRIQIPITHPLYNDVLIASLVDQDITPIIEHTLKQLGYTFTWCWHDSIKGHHFMHTIVI